MRKRLVLFLLFVGTILLFRYMGVGSYINLTWFKAQREELKLMVQEHYWRAVLAYIVFYIFSVAFSIPIAAVLTVAGGFLFGTIRGTIYANVGATIGSTGAFLIVRHLIGTAIQRRYQAQLAYFNREMQLYGRSYLLLVHFIAVIPFFLVNTFAGLTQVSTWTFIWTTSVGILPASLVYAFAGKQLQEINSLKDIFSFNIILAFVLLALLAIVPMAIKRVRGARRSIEP